jgi:serralysin
MKKTFAGDYEPAVLLEDFLGLREAVTSPPESTTAEYFDEGEPLPLAAGGTASLSTGSSSPVASIATLANWLVDGFWQNAGGIGHHWASNTITYNLGNLNTAERTLALSALTAWQEVANITFVATTGTANITFNHNGTMQAVTSASWNGAGQMTSATVSISSDWVTTDGGAYDGKTGIDSYAYQTYLHEIGHALGLGHQGPYNGSASYSTGAIFANDTWQYSIMSYFSQPNYAGSSYRYVITPQMADIYAVALMYGAATTRTGNTVYGFNNTAGSIYNFSSYSQAPALTIYDSGGTDTLDCSGYANNQVIDLRAGSYSSVGGLTNNIGIALGSVIEKAIGGSGNDQLIANDGGCTLSGGGGNDTLIGGAGADTALYSANRASYSISYNANTQSFTLIDSRSGSPDGTDTVSGVEYFQFADGLFSASGLIGQPNLSAQVFPATSSAGAGSTFSINTFVVNYGKGSAAASTSRIYLSTDATITTSDTVLATISTGALAAVSQAGYYGAQTVSVTLPGNLAPGTYYIGAIADFTNSISESDETDNTYNVAQITVTGSTTPSNLPNLSAQIFTNTTSSTAGSSVAVNTFVVNYGSGPAAASSSRIYLSTDATITTSDMVLATISSGALAAVGQSGYYDAQKLSLSLPANLAPGTYYIGAIADYNNQIFEKDETDNTYNVAQITIAASGSGSILPNLSAQVYPGSSSAAAGSTISVNTFVVNYGSTSAAASTTKVYLSTDSSITTSDIVLATINADTLAPVGQAGYYKAQTVSVVLPGTLAPGTYYIGAIADFDSKVAEKDETDNTYNVAQITVTAGPAQQLVAKSLTSTSTDSGVASESAAAATDHQRSEYVGLGSGKALEFWNDAEWSYQFGNGQVKTTVHETAKFMSPGAQSFHFQEFDPANYFKIATKSAPPNVQLPGAGELFTAGSDVAGHGAFDFSSMLGHDLMSGKNDGDPHFERAVMLDTSLPKFAEMSAAGLDNLSAHSLESDFIQQHAPDFLLR